MNIIGFINGLIFTLVTATLISRSQIFFAQNEAQKYPEAPSNELAIVDRKYVQKGRRVYLKPETVIAAKSLIKKAQKRNIRLSIMSGFRSYQYQQELRDNREVTHGIEYVNMWFARPGFSEHHTGEAIDFGSAIGHEFGLVQVGSRAYRFLQRHAPRDGFTLTYPLNNSEMAFEPWHWRHRGNLN